MFLSLIRNRRSIRKYQARPIETEKVSLLVEAALRSPSSMGNNPWEFIVVTEPELLEKLSRAKPHGSSFIKHAALTFVVCADPAKSSVWIEDASIASIFIHLAACSLDLGSCWVQIRDRAHDESVSAEDYIRNALSIPERLKVEAMIAIGYPDQKPAPHPEDELPYEKVFSDVHGTPYRR